MAILVRFFIRIPTRMARIFMDLQTAKLSLSACYRTAALPAETTNLNKKHVSLEATTAAALR